ncbi:MAG: DUF4982 domain-containing protein [Oscillospiraceae bacterium]|jgi:beta-galactosidase|nr:DUF4982 domain-containing protein [Oscillospiraceae bacterium]
MTLFNDGWFFSKNTQDDYLPVDLPHDWLISNTNDLYETGIGYYKKPFHIDSSYNDKRVYLRFDGVMMDIVLYINDIKIGEWKYGYTAFEFDITESLINNAENTILVKVNYQSPCSRWYTGAGIYRDVFLIVKNTAHFVSDGIYITPRKQSDGEWAVSVNAEVEANGCGYKIRHSIVESGETVTTEDLPGDGEVINDGTLLTDSETETDVKIVSNSKIYINNARLWDINNPYLYHLKSELLIDGIVSDTVITRFGLREIDFCTDNGFFLNGRRLKLNGVCMHHDLGALGAVVHKDAIRRQLLLLRGMGVNAIRTAHNPPAKVYMDLCDEMGFLVQSELTDIWKLPKTKYDYARFFDDWIERDVASWIRRDRNSPSVIMWSVGNEIYDTHADANIGSDILRQLSQLVLLHDPAKHAPVTLCSNFMLWENTQKCMDIIKLVGYNYAEFLYDEHHTAHPDWIIYGAETCSTTQSRGVYHFPLSKPVLSDDDLQCSVLGNCSTSWGSKNVETCLLTDLSYPFSLGQFIWSGQDYIGEPTPYHTKNSYLGHIDTAGFPKDSYYVIQAAWADEPMVYLFPYWDFSPGQEIDVRVCSNMPEVELFLNDVSLGRQALDGKLIADWQVAFVPGELRAVAYGADGHVVAAEMTRRSFGDVSELVCEGELIGELLFVTISAVDKDGNPVENANNRAIVTVENGTLIGLDNGDATDYEQYQGVDNRYLFNGKLLAIVKPDPSKTAFVNAKIDETDIPVRKIELTLNGFEVSARIFPDNATYKDLHWRLTTVGGINSHLGSLEVASDSLSAKVLPKADGEIYVRCGVMNGREHIALYTHIPLVITGLGECFLDAYSFISGGLYSFSNVTLTNGNERGVATLRDGESHVYFENVDFGSYGSDEITLGLFSLSSGPFTFEIWNGSVDSGEHLSDVYYDKGTIWNTYIDITCKLPRRLQGLKTLGFVFRQKVHIKGFQFTKLIKAFEKLPASANDGLHGDSYTVIEDRVEDIGNNVSILFKDMDFGDSGTSNISLCWQSERENNSVLVIFEGDGITDGDSESRVMLELPFADEYCDAVFPLGRRITGNVSVRFLFLPGCKINLKWVQFME